LTALNQTSLTRVLEELRAQNWTLNPSPDGQSWRAEPPDPKRKAVKFSARPSVLVPIIRELRDQGFRWPPAEKDTVPSPVVRSVPFPPKPHPDVTVERIGLAAVVPDEPQRAPLTLVKTPAPTSADEAFAKLKEAREYALLAGEELRETVTVFELAKQSRDGAQAVYDDALKQLQIAKAAFDALFNRPGDP